MSREWARTQHEGWLRKLHSSNNVDGTQALPLESTQFRLHGVLKGLPSHGIVRKNGAAQTASLTVAQDDVSMPWFNTVGVHSRAAQYFDDEEPSKTLVDYIVELANFPNAINEGPGIVTGRTRSGIK